MMSKRLDQLPKKYQPQIEKEIRKMCATIQEKREEMGHTQESLAEELEISVATLKAIEQGRRFPSLPMLFYICRFLKVEVIFK